MSKITFKVSPKKETSTISLVKEISKLAHHIQLDIENGLIIVENADISFSDPIVVLVNNHYTLLGIDIDNSVEECNADRKTNTSTPKEVAPKDSPEKAGTYENALLESFGFAFDKLDSSKKIEDQLDSFLADIGMSADEEMIKQSFIVACNIKKITFENVILELNNMYPNLSQNSIKSSLKQNFKNWLVISPELAKKYPKISFVALLKAFANKFV